MSIKKFTVRCENEMLKKLKYIANYEGRSANHQILHLMKEYIKTYEKTNGEILLPNQTTDDE